MPRGPGKFDTECEELLIEHDADAAMVIVCGGKRGSGFSMSMKPNPNMIPALIVVLRSAANQLEADLANIAGEGG
jgi:hypothetical protein